MNLRERRLSVLALSWLLVGAVSAVADGGGTVDAGRVAAPATPAEARAIADKVAAALAAALLERLQAAIGQGGVEAGARACAEVAQSVTSQVGAPHGAVARRTALRLRNPRNRPDDFEKAWLLAQDRRVKEGKEPQPLYAEVDAGPGRRELRHLRPILFPGGICSQCHGPREDIPAEVRAFLDERYPGDEATGFVAGDLRGAISVRVPVRGD
ncbi:MAG: DUF3365 domain-containing protein [Candidatus Binatia bacterium]